MVAHGGESPTRKPNAGGGTAASQPLGNMIEEPAHIQAHLVLPDNQSPNKKPKELEISEAIHERQ